MSLPHALCPARSNTMAASVRAKRSESLLCAGNKRARAHRSRRSFSRLCVKYHSVDRLGRRQTAQALFDQEISARIKLVNLFSRCARVSVALSLSRARTNVERKRQTVNRATHCRVHLTLCAACERPIGARVSHKSAASDGRCGKCVSISAAAAVLVLLAQQNRKKKLVARARAQQERENAQC